MSSTPRLNHDRGIRRSLRALPTLTPDEAAEQHLMTVSEAARVFRAVESTLAGALKLSGVQPVATLPAPGKGTGRRPALYRKADIFKAINSNLGTSKTVADGASRHEAPMVAPFSPRLPTTRTTTGSSFYRWRDPRRFNEVTQQPYAPGDPRPTAQRHNDDQSSKAS